VLDGPAPDAFQQINQRAPPGVSEYSTFGGTVAVSR
jgi:hypothetical protein